jgi:hypothetical protein
VVRVFLAADRQRVRWARCAPSCRAFSTFNRYACAGALPKHWETIADNLSKAGWSWGCVSAIDSQGRTIWIVDAHRDDGRRFIVHADEKLSAFVELERQVLTVTFYLESVQRR